MTFLSPGRTPVAGFALSVLASACGVAAAQNLPVSTMLPPVLVTATRFAEDANSLPFGVSVLTADDIRKAGVSTVNEALMKLMGVPGRLDLNGGGDYGLDLRGFGVAAGSNQVVIIDGVRLSEADMGSTRLAGIPIDAVDRIEVIRGSSAVLYGEGATSGAIVITTKGASGATRQSSAQAYMALGSQSLAEVRAGGTLVNGGFLLDVAANKRSTDGHRDNFRSSVEGLTLTSQWRNEWLRIGARHAQDKLTSGLPGSLTAAQYRDNPRQTTTPTDLGELDNHRNGIFSELTLGDWQIAFDVGTRDKTVLGLYAFYDYSYDVEAQNRSVRVRHSAPFGGLRNTVVAGVDHNNWTRVVRGSFGSTAEQVSKAVYLKDDLKLAGGTHLSAGVRAERADKTLSTAPASPIDERYNAWDLGVVQPVGSSTAVYARFGRSFRFANADEFSFTMPGVSLKPQTSRDLDLGARWSHQLNRAELRFYRNAVRDEIGYDPTASGPYGPGSGANVNFEHATLRQGVELELVHDVSAVLQLRLNAAARQAKFTDGPNDGKQVALVPKRTVSFGADWQVFEGHKLNGTVNNVSSQHPDFANSCSMPAFTTVDLRYAHKQGAVELALGVGNVTDKKYYTQAYSCAGGTPTSIYPEVGRSFVASVRVSL
ncbi:MAG: TonB-dependent receptor [Cytophagales bacterium]|nr:TonB-dependent receptor [Rhizobacter sp.]